MIYVVPSRGRPKNVSELIDAFRDTRTHACLHIALDADDPELPGYEDVMIRHGRLAWLRGSIRTRRVSYDGVVAVLNDAATRYATATTGERHAFIGFMGDDHRPRTPAWDEILANELATNANGATSRLITYGNDLLQGRQLPTAVLMRAAVVATLGYVAPPMMRHLYVDNVWLTWGRRLDAISYREDVVIEHMHPVIYKAEWDERYAVVNSGDVWAADEKAYHEYLADGLDTDLAKLRRLL